MGPGPHQFSSRTEQQCAVGPRSGSGVGRSPPSPVEGPVCMALIGLQLASVLAREMGRPFPQDTWAPAGSLSNNWGRFVEGIDSILKLCRCELTDTRI